MLITVLSGTNRPESFTRKLSGHIETLFKAHLEVGDRVELLDLTKLPTDIFVPSSYSEKPVSLAPFRDLVISADALLTVVPEYNGSAPGVLKYFIDLLPFPNALLRKPSAFVGLGSGRFGAVRAVEHMQQVWEYRNAYVYPERVFIPFVDKGLDGVGKPLDAKTAELLESEVKGFLAFAKKFA